VPDLLRGPLRRLRPGRGGSGGASAADPTKGRRRRAGGRAVDADDAPTSGKVITDAVAAAARLEALGHEPQTILAQFPALSANPVQALLTRRAWDHGFGPINLNGLRELPELRPLTDLGIRSVLHLHWTSGILRRAGPGKEGRRAVKEAVGRIDAFLGDGGKLVWTVHNVLPHGTPDAELDAALQREIVDRASVIHILTQQTADEARGVFELPAERVLHVPHPSYAGAYPDVTVREGARHRLRLDPDAIVYAFLGGIRANKGLTQLLDAFEPMAAEDPRRRLIIAGDPDGSADAQAALDRAAANPFVLVQAGPVPADEMQLYLRAADAVLLPYLSGLNSGVLMLAFTFGLPVVASDLGSFRELVTPQTGRLFRRGEVGELTAAIRSLDDLIATPESRAEARDYAYAVARQHDPDTVSTALMRGLRDRLA
jgi:beta-1,4-mannosyltransferase